MILDHHTKVVFHWMPGQQLHPLYWWTQLFVEHRAQIEYRCEKSICLTPLDRLYPLPNTLDENVLAEYSHVLILRDPYERIEDVLIEMMDHEDGARFLTKHKLDTFDRAVDYLMQQDELPLPWFRPQIEWAKQLKGRTVYAVEHAELKYQLPELLLRLGYTTSPQHVWDVKAVNPNWMFFTEKFFSADLPLFGLQSPEPKEAPKSRYELDTHELPFVSVVTPTYKRKHFLALLQECLLRQTYPRDRFEWIIVDDSPESYGNFEPDPQLKTRYVRQKEHMVLGEKRNYLCALATGSIIIPCDDDDYALPTRLEHAVQVLQEHPEALLAYAVDVPMYHIDLNKMIVVSYTSPQYSLGGTWAFRRILSEARKYRLNAHAEEYGIVDRHLPSTTLDGWKSLISFAHDRNTVSRNLSFSKKPAVDRQIQEFVPEDLLNYYFDANQAAPVDVKDIVLFYDFRDVYRPLLELAQKPRHWFPGRSGQYHRSLVSSREIDFFLAYFSEKVDIEGKDLDMAFLCIQEGGSLTPHVDQTSRGIRQYLVMLQPAEAGGHLHLNLHGNDISVPSAPGDCVSFEANKITHHVSTVEKGERYVLSIWLTRTT
jgi:glycosyltransferase involved in cell wall biosynthesis